VGEVVWSLLLADTKAVSEACALDSSRSTVDLVLAEAAAVTCC
jgi:hypothetical protein